MKTKYVHICLATRKVGSRTSHNTGYTREEWDKMTEDERTRITNEIMWDYLDIWEEDYT